MRFCFIEEHQRVYPVRVMCRVLKVSPSGYYARRGPAVETAGHMEIARRVPQALGKPADGFPTVPHSPDDD